MKKEYVILKDVAERAGVSIPTASRVINKEKYVSNEVKNKVLNAVRELKYEPGWTARNLRLGKTNIISVIIPNIANYFFSSIVRGVEKYYGSLDKDIILFDTNNNQELEKRAIRLAIAKRAEGIVLATISNESLEHKSSIPIVVVDNKLNNSDVDFVLHDDVNGAYKLVNHLIKVHGFKKIACISGPLHESSGLDKLLGYKKALEENNISIKDEYIKIANWKKEQAFYATRDLLNLKNKPEAIFTANTNMVIGSLRYINNNNIKVPEDVAIVTFDDYDYVSAFNPPLTTLERVDIKMGEIAADLLNKRINKEKSEFKEIKVDAELIIRKSCGCNKISDKF